MIGKIYVFTKYKSYKSYKLKPKNLNPKATQPLHDSCCSDYISNPSTTMSLRQLRMYMTYKDQQERNLQSSGNSANFVIYYKSYKKSSSYQNRMSH